VLVAVLCALAAALLYAFASVLQQRGAAGRPGDESMRIGLLWRLAHEPGWVLGVACDVGAYVLQFVALGHGPLVVVQPLLVCGLLFALPVGAALDGRRMGGSDWVGAVCVCAGLAAFLVTAHPAAGRDNVRPLAWSVLLLSVAAVAAGLLAAARGRRRRGRALLLSASAGVVYGAAAALTKTTSHLLGRGVVDVLGSWQLYALVAFGLFGMLAAQSAFQAGALDVSLPVMTVADPVVSIVIGATMFSESVRSSPGAASIEVAALSAMAGGVFLLARTGGLPRRAPPAAERTTAAS
jgi:drug/metabolite transporter (DMT)-like permease